jgi:alkylation response protein AidB-like acyl-CoA dehydrogenase
LSLFLVPKFHFAAETGAPGARDDAFVMIEHTRMLVGTKAIGTLSVGYLAARGHAKERVQGADLPKMLDKAAPRVTIAPDLRHVSML